MKFTMFVTENIAQVNLTPENPHEKAFLSVLSKYQGSVTLHHGISIEECQGGYLRNFGLHDMLAITIKKENPPCVEDTLR